MPIGAQIGCRSLAAAATARKVISAAAAARRWLWPGTQAQPIPCAVSRLGTRPSLIFLRRVKTAFVLLSFTDGQIASELVRLKFRLRLSSLRHNAWDARCGAVPAARRAAGSSRANLSVVAAGGGASCFARGPTPGFAGPRLGADRCVAGPGWPAQRNTGLCDFARHIQLDQWLAFLLRRLLDTEPTVRLDPVLEARTGRELRAAVEGNCLTGIGWQAVTAGCRCSVPFP